MILKRRFLAWLAFAFVLGAGAAVISAWTLGLSAFTSYSYALNSAGALPRAAPDFAFIDQFGNERRLASLRGRHVLLHAFYGTCLAVCPVVIEQLRELYADLNEAKRRELVILSLSVDPARDTAEHRVELWRETGAVANWIVAQPTPGSLDQVTQQFGIWVLARTDGTINHSADLFLIDPDGRIVRVVAPTADVDLMRRDVEEYL